MRLLSKLFLLLFLFSFLWPAYAETNKSALKPKTRPITIKPITQDVIHIMPGRAVRIIFPWVLGKEVSDTLPYYGKLSQQNLLNFEAKEDQNSILITTKAIASNLQGEYTELSVTSRGYFFSFTVIADFSTKRHYSNIVLKLGEKERMRLLEDEKKRFLASLNDEREKMIAEIDGRAERLALKKVGELSQGSRSSSNIKEESKRRFDNGDELILYVDKVKKYGSFSVINIEIENRSSIMPIYLHDLILKNSDNISKDVFFSDSAIPPKLDTNQVISTVIVTNDTLPDENVALRLTTNRGEVEVIW